MKKVLLFIILFLSPILVFAKQRDEVLLSKCVDGDTARFILNNNEIKVRFIGIDTPELSNNEDYAVDASLYTCKMLKNAEKIELEYEENIEKDKYNRTLAYIFVDNKLLEELLVKNGYARVKYINDDYLYYDRLVKAEKIAKKNKKGIFSEEKISENNIEKIKNFVIKYSKKIFSNILKEIFD